MTKTHEGLSTHGLIATVTCSGASPQFSWPGKGEAWDGGKQQCHGGKERKPTVEDRYLCQLPPPSFSFFLLWILIFLIIPLTFLPRLYLPPPPLSEPIRSLFRWYFAYYSASLPFSSTPLLESPLKQRNRRRVLGRRRLLRLCTRAEAKRCDFFSKRRFLLFFFFFLLPNVSVLLLLWRISADFPPWFPRFGSGSWMPFCWRCAF